MGIVLVKNLRLGPCVPFKSFSFHLQTIYTNRTIMCVGVLVSGIIPQRQMFVQEYFSYRCSLNTAFALNGDKFTLNCDS